MIIEISVIRNPSRLVPSTEKWETPETSVPVPGRASLWLSPLALWWGLCTLSLLYQLPFSSSVYVSSFFHCPVVGCELASKSNYHIVQKWIGRDLSSLPPSPLEETIFIALIRAWSCGRKCKSSSFFLTASNWGGNLETLCCRKCQLDN